MAKYKSKQILKEDQCVAMVSIAFMLFWSRRPHTYNN